MAEKVTIGNCELWHGDCREVLPQIEADACVTDPPYGIAYQHSGGGDSPVSRDMKRRGVLGKNANKPIHGDDEPFDPAPLLRFPIVLMFGADHYRARLPPGGTMIAWDKHIGIGPNDSFADAEYAWTNLKVKRNVFRYLWKGVACEKAGEEGGRRYHPTTKPQGLMRWCLELMPNAKTIADPYMGSGSTGVAAVALGRAFVGVEIHRPYFDIACERIAAAQAQGQLFSAPKVGAGETAVQGDMLLPANAKVSGAGTASAGLPS